MTITRRDFLSASLAVAAASQRAALGLQQAPDPLHSLILGGTGFLGPHVVERALSRGHTVTLFNRGRTNLGLFTSIAQLRGDRKTDLSALEGRSWDAVVDTSAYIPADVTRVATLLAPRVGGPGATCRCGYPPRAPTVPDRARSVRRGPLPPDSRTAH